MKVSIIITVHNRADMTLRCLESLSRNTRYPDWEVVIADNGSTDETAQILKSLEGDVKVLRSEENLGFARGNNRGSRAAGGQLFCFLNNDTEVEAGWLEALTGCMDSHPGAAICGGKLLFPDGKVQHAGLIFDKEDRVAYHVYRGLPGDAAEVNRERRLKAVTGACMLIKREYFEAAEGFDEGYINGYEDVDLCLRIGRLKGEIYYTPECRVVHHTSSTPGRNDFEEQNYLRFRAKWHDKIEADEDKFLAADGYRAEWKGVNCTLKEVWCDIVIPVFNHLDYTRRCLDSIAANTGYPKYRVIVIDNGSGDGTGEYLRSRRDLTVISNLKNEGYARACNQGAASSRGELLMFLNNDTEVRAGWLNELAASISDPGVSIAGGKLLYPDGSVQHSGIVFDKRDQVGYHLYAGQPGEAFYVNRQREFKAVTGACMMVKREFFDKAGGFDESYVNGREDIDLCLRAVSSGGRIVYNPNCVVVHHESKTSGRKDSDGENIARFLEVWGGKVKADEDDYYGKDGFSVQWTGRNDYQLNYTGIRAAIVITPVPGQDIIDCLKRMIACTEFPDFKIYLQVVPGMDFPEQFGGVLGRIDDPDIIKGAKKLAEKFAVVVPMDFDPPAGWLSRLYLWCEDISSEEMILNGKPQFGYGWPDLDASATGRIKYLRHSGGLL